MNALQIAIDAISLGAIYALAALGIGLIFSIMRLINFAHGELIMVGGFCLYSLAGQPLLVMAVAAILVCAVAALGMEQLAFRPLRKAKPGTLLISSFAVSYLLQHIALMIFGSRPVGMDFLGFLSDSVEFAGLRVPKLQIAAVLVTTVLLTALALFFKYSRMGVQMRAAAENFTMARLVGVKANQVIAMAFAMSGILASFVSMYLVAQTGNVSYKMGVSILLVAFVASVVGGLGSLVGAAIGGLLVGVLSVVLQSLLPIDLRPYRDAFVFLAFIAFLVWRPQGLMTRRADMERV